MTGFRYSWYSDRQFSFYTRGKVRGYILLRHRQSRSSPWRQTASGYMLDEIMFISLSRASIVWVRNTLNTKMRTPQVALAGSQISPRVSPWQPHDAFLPTGKCPAAVCHVDLGQKKSQKTGLEFSREGFRHTVGIRKFLFGTNPGWTMSMCIRWHVSASETSSPAMRTRCTSNFRCWRYVKTRWTHHLSYGGKCPSREHTLCEQTLEQIELTSSR